MSYYKHLRSVETCACMAVIYNNDYNNNSYGHYAIIAEFDDRL